MDVVSELNDADEESAPREADLSMHDRTLADEFTLLGKKSQLSLRRNPRGYSYLVSILSQKKSISLNFSTASPSSTSIKAAEDTRAAPVLE